MMSYLSVCSGIEAASVAWHSLGWVPVAFSEIEKFPSSVLAHHYPSVPNWGDMTKFKTWPHASIDILVGGTPCQAFSVAGLRKGLDDPRGNLTLTFLAIARKYSPRWILWENVPGVLSDRGNAFGQFLAGMGELGYGWAYRVLDAQYFGVAQRRRRVFVVGYAGDWRRAAAVLFEQESLRGDSAPSREAREDVAARSGFCPAVSGTLDRGVPARSGGAAGYFDHMIAHTIKAEGHDASEDGTGRGVPLWPCAAPTLNAAFGDKQGLEDQHALNGGGFSSPAKCITSKQQRNDFETENLIPMPQAVKSFNWQSGGDCRGLDLRDTAMALTKEQVPAIAFSMKDDGGDAGELAPTLRAGGHAGSHANGGVMPAVAFNLRGREGGTMPEMADQASLRAASGGSSRSYIATSAVRRLTPRECERLQGFPDDYTLIPVGKKLTADGPRYKALGNSMAVPVMAWIGRRIAMADAIKP